MTISRPSMPHKPLVEPKQRRPAGGATRGDTTMPVSWRRAQAQAAPDRLQARQDRDSGDRGFDRIRSQPFRAHRVAELRRRREALHPAARRARRWDRRLSAARMPTSWWATHCRCSNIPPGTTIHNVELQPGKGAQMVRSAGGSAQLVAKGRRVRAGEAAFGRNPQGVRRTAWPRSDRWATLDHENVTIGKAGRMRWMGWRPHNRGVSMNPVDHPHGGGEGKTSGGRHPVTPWGQPTRGYKTRNNKRTRRVHRDGRGRSERSSRLSAIGQRAQVVSAASTEGLICQELGTARS